MPANTTSTPAILEQVMQADRFRLTKWWRKLSQRRQSNEILKWQSAAEASAEVRRQRADAVPSLSFDPELPITSHREEIVELLRTRQTIVVCGETGSGKSTQLPKLCLEAGLGIAGMIGHTQPRRLAARAVAARLAEELSSRIGDAVGFKIRFTDKTDEKRTLVKLMTDGVLLAETQGDRFLDRYDALIIDEAHERSLNIDFLMGYLRQMANRRPDLKLVITSATIDPERFAKHFADEQGPAPIVEVSGRGYPVEVLYRPVDRSALDADDQVLPRAIAEAVDELVSLSPGDILTFLPTERDIRLTAKYLRGHFTGQGIESSTEILPLYARLSQAEQNKIFAKHSKRRIILATNVAESSLTVPGIHYVIDTGLVRISRYAPRSKVQRLPIEDISQASANQRAGRCGRLGPGTCIRLFDEDDFNSRPKFTTPEIRRSDLASVLLQSLVLRLGPLDEFPLLDPPTPESLRDGERTLVELGAIDERRRLTDIGRRLGSLPCEPRVGRMLIEANERNCLEEVMIIAAALEGQDVRQRPAGKRPQADEAHLRFLDPHSDFLSYIRLWDFYHHLREDLGRSRLQRALNQNFLSLQGFREWSDIVRQLREILAGAGIRAGKRRLKLPEIDPKTFVTPRDEDDRGASRKQLAKREKLARPAQYAAIHQSLLSGLLSGVAARGERNEYQAARGLKIFLWPGSGLFKRQPKWIMTAEIVETTRCFGRTNAEVDIEWIEKAGANLLKHSYSDPHWSSKAGSAMVYRRSTLYGLPIVVGRRVPLAPLDTATARSLMIEHGLVAGEWECREKFYQHNQELLADMHELVQRTRSTEFILDRFHLMHFYNERVPAEVFDLNTLRAWIRQNPASSAEQRLWMQPEDLMRGQSGLEELETRYPNSIRIGDSSFPVQYHFEPGSSQDGVAVTIPRAALRQVSEEALGWLVPGLLEEKVLQLIRSLPKRLRTSFVPAPDIAKKIATELNAGETSRPFHQILCEAMSRHAGETVRSSDFQAGKLSEHLRFLIRVVDDDGAMIEESRDLQKLQQEHAPPQVSMAVESPSGEIGDWGGQAVTAESFESLPEKVEILKGGVLVAAFPALVDLGDRIEQRLSDTAAEAGRVSQRGFTRLWAIKHHRSLRGQVAHLPGLEQATLQLAHLIPTQELRNQLENLIARLALVEDQPMIRDRAAWEARDVQAKARISIAAQEVTSWLPKLASQVHELRLKCERPPGSWQEVVEDIQRQLQQLFPADFLLTIPWRALVEYPRYLAAASMRIEKLGSGGIPKDRRLREPIERLWDVYQQLNSAPHAMQSREKLEEFRWLLEEFRVSIFAQTLGTKQSVSEKRLRQFLGGIEA